MQSAKSQFRKDLKRHIPDAFLLKVCAVARSPFEIFPSNNAEWFREHISIQLHILCIFDTVFDWSVDPHTKNYKAFKLQPENLMRILEEIKCNPQSASN